jgi:hypothetical protein
MYALIELRSQNVIDKYSTLLDALQTVEMEQAAGGDVSMWGLYSFEGRTARLLLRGGDLSTFAASLMRPTSLASLGHVVITQPGILGNAAISWPPTTSPTAFASAVFG